MTIAKAIEILSDSAYRGITTFDKNFRDAERLGIEALKLISDFRLHPLVYPYILLPGETEE